MSQGMIGDFVAGSTIRRMWGTYAVAGESITRGTNGTISVYKDGGLTQSTAGVTDTEDFDSLTGVHLCAINTAADTAFYEAGSTYEVVLSAAGVDSKTINAPLFSFTLRASGTAFVSLSGWPTTTDISARFTDMGVTAPATDTMTAVRNAVVAAWERITGFDPFLGTGVDATRYYAPRGGKVIDFGGGITAAPTSLTINGTYTDAGVFENGTALVVNRDYTLLPLNALAKGKPYTHARVTRYYTLCYFEWASIKVVAPFGYAATVPADAWEAVMRGVLSLLLPSAGVEVSGGLSEWKEEDVSERYGAEGPIPAAVDYFMQYEQGVLLGYKMERMNLS